MKRLVPISLLVAAALVGCTSDGAGTDANDSADSAALAGVTTYEIASRDHVTGRVDYPQNPPVGGDHAPIWQNCGFYSQPIAKENGVHSMEHGAVWITFDPDLDPDQVDRLRELAKEPYTLVSPFPGLESPVVASAWGKQLTLAAADDPSLPDFLTQFRQGPQTPEPGAVCNGALGSPE